MKLLFIHIDNFGKLRDFDLSLNDGVNTVFADNGFGKTTLAAFVKAMLYGLPQNSARIKSLDANERKHYTPWQGGTFGGYIEIETGKGRYRVSRTFGAKPAADTFSLIDLDTKLESFDYSSDIGTELFGIGADSYEKSTYLPQRDISLEMTSDIAAKLNRLLESSDDLADLDRAVDLLENYSKRFKLYRGNGGLISDTRKKLDQTVAEISKCEQAASDAEEGKVIVEGYKNELDEFNRQIGELDRKIREINELKLKYNDHETLKGYIKDAEKTQSRIDELERSFISEKPNDEQISALERQVQNILVSEANVKAEADAAELNANLETLKDRFGDEPLSDTEIQAILAKHEEIKALESKRISWRHAEQPEAPAPTRSNAIPIVSVAAAVAAVGVALAFVMLPAAIAAFVLSAVLICLGVALSSSAKKKDAENQKRFEELDAQYRASKEEFFELEAECETKKTELNDTLSLYYPGCPGGSDAVIARLIPDTENYSRLLQTKKATDERVKILEAKLDADKNKVYGILRSYGCVACDDFLAAVSDVWTRLMSLKNLHADLDARQRQIKAFKEEKALTDELPDIPDARQYEKQRDDILFKVSVLTNKIGRASTRIEDLESDAEPLPTLIDEADRLRGEIAAYEEKRETAERAKEYLKRASDGLSSKYLRKMEQSFYKSYSEISSGDMPAPDINAELGISFRDGGEGRGAEWYSKGIKSLISVCMRLALSDALFENEAPFFIFDDPFTELDGTKLEKAKKLISELGNDRQIIYLTCHESRKI